MRAFRQFRRGQVAVYLLVTLVALTLLALLNVDVFNSVRAKMRTENAGDAAALAAARRQGELLNEIGRLNLEHISAAIACDRQRCDEIVLRQRKLALLGPLDALRQANEAAKKNGQERRRQFEEILLEHAQVVRVVYGGGGQGADPYPESWPGAWKAYAMEIEQVAGEGLAAGADNIEFYNYATGHPLLEQDFYHAIAGRNWCWFKFHWPSLLEQYSGYDSWWDLPAQGHGQSFVNSEVFSLHVAAVQCPILERIGRKKLVEILEATGTRLPGGVPFSEEDLAKCSILTNLTETWFFFEPGAWREWGEMDPFGGFEDNGPMPTVGPVKPEYNVRGAAAICRCVSDVPAVAVDGKSKTTWTAAAKPFGSIELEGYEGALPVTAAVYFILPVFSATRLVPIDSVGGRDLATADWDWVEHVRKHLGLYLERGPFPRNCYWCRQLVAWENPVLRSTGATWLKFNGDTCRRPKGGGGGHGGTAHAH